MSDTNVKIRGIVIKSNQSGENDRVLSLLSPEMGKLTVIAKGVRSLKHQSRASAAVLSYSSFVLKKIKDGFYSLVSAEVIESFRNLSEDIELLSYGAYFASLCEMCVQHEVPADEEVRLLLNSLYILGKRKNEAYVVKTVFEIKLCELCGIMPEFDKFCPCGEPASSFSISDGEMRCTVHADNNCISLSPSALAFAVYIVQNPLKESLFAQCSFSDCMLLWKAIESFISYHLGTLPKSLTFLHNLVIK